MHSVCMHVRVDGIYIKEKLLRKKNLTNIENYSCLFSVYTTPIV